MNFSRRSTLLAAGTLSAAALLAGCSTGSSSKNQKGSGSGSSDTNYPVSIKHVYGETKIEKQPTRVAAISWVNADVVLALGVVPVGMPFISWGGDAQGLTPWLAEALKKNNAELGSEKAPQLYSETDGINFDAIAKANPDVILGVYSGMTKEDYEKLSKIAPTIGYPEMPYGTPWDTTTSTIGQALGKNAEAKKVIEEKKGLFAQARKEHPEFEGKSFIFANLEPSKGDGLNVYTSIDNRPRFMEELGMKLAPVAAEAEKKAEKKKFFVPFSAENASTLESDILASWVSDPAKIEKILKDKLLSQIPAIKKNAYAFSADKTVSLALSATSPLSIDYALKNFVPLFSKALKHQAK